MPEDTDSDVQFFSANAKARIMVVDDNSEYLGTISVILGSWGHDVLSFTSGRFALEQLEKVSPDIVILDYMMPEMDGVRLLMRLRELPIGRSMPAIMLTASDTDALRRQAQSLGVIAVIAKSAPLQCLAEAIQVAVSREPS